MHLLARSGAATQITIELLLRPIMSNATVCTYSGSSEFGVNLPLHSKCIDSMYA